MLDIVRERGLDPSEINILMGVDDSQGILKVKFDYLSHILNNETI